MEYYNMKLLLGAKMRYYSKGQYQETVNLVKDKVSVDITSIEKELLCIFNDMVTKEPCYYWNNDIYNQTFAELSKLSTGKIIDIDDEIFVFIRE